MQTEGRLLGVAGRCFKSWRGETDQIEADHVAGQLTKPALEGCDPMEVEGLRPGSAARPSFALISRHRITALIDTLRLGRDYASPAAAPYCLS